RRTTCGTCSARSRRPARPRSSSFRWSGSSREVPHGSGPSLVVRVVAGRCVDSTKRYGRAPAGLGGCLEGSPRRQRRQSFAERRSAARERKAASAVRRSLGFDDIWPRVTEIVADVRDRGDAAVAAWAERVGDRPPERVAVEPQELEPDVERALRSLVETVTAVHSAERPADVAVEPRPGVVVERRWLPLDSVGIYVPSGRFPLPSSLVMAAVPARVAGVRRVCVVSPRPAPATLAVAALPGIDDVHAA